MACTSLTALQIACGSQGIVSGIERLYVVAFNDLDASTGSTFTTASNGMVSAITLDTGKKYVEVGVLRDTVELKDSYTANPSNGTGFHTQSFDLTLAGLTPENYAFIESVKTQPVSILIKSRLGNYFAAGLNGLMQLEKMEGGTGKAAGDLQGYTLTFSGIATKSLTQVDPTIVAALIA
ncbi:MAG: hypothetical protein ACJ749_11830 [Flavisolibacter sp.]